MLQRRPVVISNEIRLKQSQHGGAFIVVEGRDDRLFYERYIHDSCNLVVGEGKESVQEVIRILDGSGFSGVVGLVDADFDVIEGEVNPNENIVITDAHDLETVLLRSPALDRVLLEFGSQRKIETAGKSVRDLLLEAAAPVGYLRWFAMRERLGLRFRGLNFAACIDSATLTLHPQAMIREVKNLSQRPDLDERELEKECKALEDPGHDMWQICCGKDLVHILSTGLRGAIGTNSAQAVKPDALRRSLRLAVDEAEFRAFSVHQSVQRWEAKNPPFRVFR